MNRLRHILGRHDSLSMHLPQATSPIHHAAQLTALQKVMVPARYESPHSINEQPLFNSPAKHPHLPGAARGDEDSLPGGRLAVRSLRKQLPLQLQG